jgi:23S rRNA (cytosine1962-C5)-methyltransferase
MEVLKLHRGREQSLLRKHPWIFSRALQKVPKSVGDGDVVEVQDADNNTVGVGHFQNGSIMVRMLAFEAIAVDAAFWRKRLAAAWQYRHRLSFLKANHTDCFRLIHGEGDQLPGLIIDIYSAIAVVQAHSVGMHKSRQQIAEALLKIDGLTIHAVYCKSKESLPQEYAKSVEDEWLQGEPVEDFITHEGGVQFYVNVVSGQKTGFFLDQRINRELLRQYASGRSVLNCFCYTGGFSLYALQGGAAAVTSIDSSAGAMDMVDKNVALNAFQGTHESVRDNVMHHLTASHIDYDIVVIDPPAFAKNIEKRHNAVQAYKRLNMLAMARVRPGGLLFTFSCSQVVDRALFHNTVVAAAIEIGRPARVVHELSQGPDHPVSLFHPEGHYLKGLVVHLE